MSTHPDENSIPLVVDLDDTLLRTDLLYECFWHGMGIAPVRTLGLCLKHWSKPAILKQALAESSGCDIDLVPIDPEIKAECRTAKGAGRQVVLASASTAALVEPIAKRTGLFDEVHASDTQTNLSGNNKAAFLTEKYPAGFDYIGDSPKDFPVWQAARNAIVARPTKSMTTKLQNAGIEAKAVGQAWQPIDLVRGLRPHQWVKNVLLALPPIAAHSADMGVIFAVIVGIISFSAAASSIYIINDLTDLDADRAHPTKSERVFAAGRVPIRIGMMFSIALGLFSLLLAALLNTTMLVVILVYILTTLTYSMRLKRERWIDVATLASLYTLRVVAGAVAAVVPASGWLIAFIFPVFLTLACVKRLTELAKATTDGPLPGRRYQKSDRGDLLNVSILGALAAVGVFIGYTFSDTAAGLYDNIWVLRLVAIPLALWQVRMIITGWSGAQAYDPIVFALRDKIGLSLLAVSFIALMIAAS